MPPREALGGASIGGEGGCVGLSPESSGLSASVASASEVMERD